MKYGIISDIHSNFNAFKVVIDYLANEEKVDGYFCVGDIVGYGAKPNECVELVRSLKNCLNVIGNHEWAVLGSDKMDNYNSAAREAMKWTAGEINENNIKWIKSLRKTVKNRKLMIVHGSPRNPVNEYVTSETVFKDNIPFIEPDVCLIGHTHISEYFIRYEPGGKIKSPRLKDNDIIEIKPSCKYMINCGSVGQPRGGTDNRASFGIYDDSAGTVRIKKLPYDIK